ncbi:MAG: RAMP superfamily CRISPR-associated protein [Nocardioides sp.]
MTTRTYARVDLVIEHAWRIGAWQTSGETNDDALLSVTRLADDTPYLPAASIRGGIRAHLAHYLAGAAPDSDARLAAALGPPPGAPDLTASAWWVLGCQLPQDTRAVSEPRGQTAIDRHRRAPRGTYRRSETVMAIGPGPHVRIYLRCDHAADAQASADVLTALQTWQPRIGGSISSGLGRARVAEIRYQQVAIDTTAGLVAFLTASNGPDGIDALLADPATTSITPDEPSGAPLIACDFTVPHGWAVADADKSRGWMDGSTWKGLLRSRVEYIGRSLGATVCGDSRSPQGPDPCGICDVCHTFGSPDAAAAISVATTTIQRPSTHQGASTRQRTALDRYTGGASDQQLFAQSEEFDLRLRLRVDPSPRPSAPEPPLWVKRAMLHAVRDLADGVVGVGPASSTGLGTLSATACTIGPDWAASFSTTESTSPDLRTIEIPLSDLDQYPVEVPSP